VCSINLLTYLLTYIPFRLGSAPDSARGTFSAPYIYTVDLLAGFKGGRKGERRVSPLQTYKPNFTHASSFCPSHSLTIRESGLSPPACDYCHPVNAKAQPLFVEASCPSRIIDSSTASRTVRSNSCTETLSYSKLKIGYALVQHDAIFLCQRALESLYCSFYSGAVLSQNIGRGLPPPLPSFP